jgi:acetyl-CoA carboxylase biotin carboxyl carrier protein
MRKKNIKSEPPAPRRADAPSPSAQRGKDSGDPGAIDVEQIRELAAIVESHGLSELRLTMPAGVLLLRRGGASAMVSSLPAHTSMAPVVSMMPSGASMPPVAIPMPAAAEPAPATPALAGQSTSPTAGVQGNGQVHVINSPFVGTFYRSPSPEAPSFVEIGQKVKKGQVLCIVEAMKLMNEIEAEIDGTVVACLAENAQPVEYGQTLFKLSP